jgi:hypothetical protein
MITRTLPCCVVVLLTQVFAAPTYAAYQTNVTPIGQWGATDATLGLNPSAVIENFEDTTLASGLKVQVANSSSGAYGPTSTLPSVFDATVYDGFGYAFSGGNWDGKHALLNTGNNQSAHYASTSAWGDVTFTFSGGLSQLGFSIQQMQHDAVFTLNGTTSLYASSLGLDFSGGRSGYLRIDVTGNSAPITSLSINGSIYDAWTIDHLAMTTAVPEPQAYLLMLTSLLALGLVRRRAS